MNTLPMHEINSLLARHGYALTFALLFGEAIGLPLPAAVALAGAGAASAAHTLSPGWVLFGSVAAMLVGDTLQFVLGRHMGWTLLGLLCRVSANPETCILRSAESFYKRGKTTLLISKFIPGINTMAAPLAGSMRMRYSQFIRFDAVGAMLYTFAYFGAGYAARDLLARILDKFSAAGHIVELVVAAAVLAYIVYRLVLFVRNRRYRIVPRVQVQELAEKLKAEEAGNLMVADVRSHGYYDSGTQRIQGSIRLEPNNLDEEIKGFPRDKDIYLYCT
jgi:membrane protein DedA with SNARE-associated domain